MISQLRIECFILKIGNHSRSFVEEQKGRERERERERERKRERTEAEKKCGKCMYVTRHTDQRLSKSMPNVNTIEY